MKFKMVRWKNFLSTGNVFTEVDLTGFKNTLIIGSNGAGKSTVLDALCYGLFGKPFRNINKPQLVNSVNQKELLVEIEFSIGSEEYLIRRGQKPGIFEILRDGIPINQDSNIKDYQDMFEKHVLKRNMKSFCQIEILGSASFVPFMALPPGNRRQIVEDLLDLEIFSIMSQENKDFFNETKNKIGNLNVEIESLERSIRSQEELVKKIARQNKEHIEYIRNLSEQKRHQADGVNLELKRLSEELIKVSNNLNLVENPDVERALLLEERMKNKLRDLKKKIQDSSKTICSECGQNLPHDWYKISIEDLEGEKTHLEEGLEKLKGKISEMRGQKEERDKIKKNFDRLELEVHTLRQSFEGLIQEADNLDSEANRTEQDINTAAIEDTSLDELNEELTRVRDEKKNSLIEQKISALTASALKDDGIKAQIVRRFVPIINESINRYLSIMDFYADFELDETFLETIRSRHRDTFSYASFSEGEKMRIDLAILFTWRKVARLRNTQTSNLLLMDEVLDSSLDLTAKEALMKIIQEDGDVNTFVISHNVENIGDNFDRTIEFKKDGNFSMMEVK